jgi:hypothetical protein
MEIKPENVWVDQRLAALEPPWNPNAARARESLDARLSARGHSFRWMAVAAAAAVFLVVLALPESRAIAQQLWDRFVLNRVEAVRVDLSQFPVNTHVTTNGREEVVPNVLEAEQKAGFRPHLPSPAIVAAEPELKVSGPMRVDQILRLRDLRSALAKAGVTGVQVPSDWDGATFHLEVGPVVTAEYPDTVRVVQLQPIHFSAPSGFPLEAFAEVAFRSLGVSAWEAQELGRRFAEHPFWMLDIPPEKVAEIQTMTLNGSPSLLIEDADGATIIRTTGERIYAVTSGTRQLSMRIAESLP